MSQTADDPNGSNTGNPADLGNLFSIVVAETELRTKFNAVPLQEAGLCFKPSNQNAFSAFEHILAQLLLAGEQVTRTQYRILDDPYGFRWIILKSPAFEDLVTAIYLTAETFEEHALGSQLLVASFLFSSGKQEIEWIFNFKNYNFYPFVPIPGNNERNNSLELRLFREMGGAIPIEPQLENWHPIFDIPFEGR